MVQNIFSVCLYYLILFLLRIVQGRFDFYLLRLIGTQRSNSNLAELVQMPLVVFILDPVLISLHLNLFILGMNNLIWSNSYSKSYYLILDPIQMRVISYSCFYKVFKIRIILILQIIISPVQMINCSIHHKQFVGYLPLSKKAVCPQCEKSSQQIIPFNGKLQTLRHQIKRIEQFVFKQLAEINIHEIREQFNNQYGPQFVQHNNKISKDIEQLQKQQAEFWNLLQVKLVYHDKVQMNWELLIEHGVLDDEIKIENSIRIKQFLEKRINAMKEKANQIKKEMKEEKNKTNHQNRESQPFQNLIDDNSSGSSAEDMMEVGIPDEVSLNETNKQLAVIMEKKKEEIAQLYKKQQQQAKKISKKQKNEEEQLKQQMANAWKKGKKPQPESPSSILDSQDDKNQKEQKKLKDVDQITKQSQHKSKEEVQAEMVLTLVSKLQEKLEYSKYEQALVLIQQILAIQSSHKQILHLKAKILVITNQIEKSSDIYSTLAKQQHRNNTIKYETALVHFKNKMYNQCKTLIQQLFEGEIIQVQYYILKGDCLLYSLSADRPFDKKISDSKQILQCYTAAMKLSPKTKQYIYRVALYYINQRLYEMALQMINQALQLDPLNVMYLKTKSWLKFKLIKYGEAVQNYKQVRSISQTPQTINNFAIFLFFNKQQDQSKQQILKAYSKYPLQKTIVLNALIILSYLKNFNEAFKIVKETFEHFKLSEIYILKACQIATNISDRLQAKAFLSNLVKIRRQYNGLNKQFYIGFYSLAFHLKEKDIIEDGIQFLSEKLAADSEDYKKPQIYNLLGVLKASRGQTGLDQFKLAITSSLQIQLKCAYLWNCAVASYKKDLFQQALQLIEKAIVMEKKGKKHKYFQFKINLLIKNQNYAKATESLEQLKDGHPSHIKEQTYQKIMSKLKQLMN